MLAFVVGIAFPLLVAGEAGYMVLTNGVIPASADSQPTSLEKWASGTSLDATLRREAPEGPNPVALADANLITGIELYGMHCAISKSGSLRFS